MRGKRARELRKAVYGEDLSPRARKYVTLSNGVIRADQQRNLYQQMKRSYNGTKSN